jgi:hypothetical protein
MEVKYHELNIPFESESVIKTSVKCDTNDDDEEK